MGPEVEGENFIRCPTGQYSLEEGLAGWNRYMRARISKARRRRPLPETLDQVLARISLDELAA